ncbi:hypothetical protein CDES_01220 [Corynebacterium deserti GIMN1.010]|uniref:ABC transporter domain-containing protein n=1 Tax=Corynebacterium deserti GIMN1.010 TaxID=931089 RepID=A0A0M3Q8Z7_9CORY|nr:ABC transporter ATP-binding protein [Corynebacterium deserti]ALC04723.1 hypothetical protein CDES_01220 [Corynebacterium deserti GIMN1.010]
MDDLQVRNVSRFFGESVALNDVSLTLSAGTITSIMGPSGSGKTTLLRLLAGLDSPDVGKVLIGDAPATLGEAALCFQASPLYPHLNVWDNVAFPLKLKAVKASDDVVDQRVRRVLSMLNIEQLSGRKINELSGGQKQRVGIARALVRDVKVYLFDEPMAHLDQALAREIVADLRKIQQELGLTFVYVTHSKSDAFAISDQIVILVDGKVAQVGSAEEVVDKPTTLMVAEFLSPTELTVRRSGGDVSAWRPEDTTLTRGGAAVVESVTYLGREWLVRTNNGAAVTSQHVEVGEKVTLTPTKVFRF